eukprot:767335-Hanusia_phi.AAC.2
MGEKLRRERRKITGRKREKRPRIGSEVRVERASPAVRQVVPDGVVEEDGILKQCERRRREERRSGEDRTGQDRTGQDRTGQDRTGQEKS